MSNQRFDIIIRNGRIIDGTGSPWYYGDLGIRDGKVATIGTLNHHPADKTIDAQGMIVTPGFIDMLGQSELTILVDPRVPSKIFQGITTEFTGEGGSAAPLSDFIIEVYKSLYQHYDINPDWRNLRQYFARLEEQKIGINIGSYIGATQIRRMVLEDADRAPNREELDKMRALVSEAMMDGAVGVSTALQYAPAPFASTEELIALAAESAKFGGIYATHLRSEGKAITTAINEAIRIGREAHIAVEIWHLKTAGVSNWGRMAEVISQIEAARESGVDIAADTYAYPAWFNSFSAFIPPWAHEGGPQNLIARLKDAPTRARIRAEIESPIFDWDNQWQVVPGSESILVSVVFNPDLLPLQGQTIAQIAKLWGKDPLETIFDLLIQDDTRTFVAVFGLSEADVKLALLQPWVSVDCDSQGTSPEGALGKEHPHPRAYGTFPRILRKYVREEKILRLEEAIRKFTALPAQRMNLADRGVLKAGMWADVVVFDPERVQDLSTFEAPNQLSVGMQHVLVNGVPVIEDGQATNELPGKVLRGQGYNGS
jgi:dihydroorotase/N-acyl-D-amino-acid deacylase